MSQFSSTRAADKQAAFTANAQLQPAIACLRASTAMGVLNELEVFEVLQAMAANAQ